MRHTVGYVAAGLLIAVSAAAMTPWARTGSTSALLPLQPGRPVQPAAGAQQAPHGPSPTSTAGPGSEVTLAFAGDVHFQLHLAALLDHPRGALGPIARTLSRADVAMVNLETSITTRGVRLHQDYAFRTSPAALDLLAAAGFDVATMANNHGVDYGPVGLRDTLRAVRSSPIAVVGIGRSEAAALAPYRVSVRGTDIAIFAASAEPDQLARSAAGPGTPGIAAAFGTRPTALMTAVRAASTRGDLVVVYLHWGTELRSCPTGRQHLLARSLAEAGADIIVGSHAHVLLGAGWLGDTYVDYGLGNFLWYHDGQPQTGVLQLRVRDGAVISDSFAPARIQTFGRPLPLTGAARSAAVGDWRRLRTCTGLADHPPSASSPDRLRP